MAQAVRVVTIERGIDPRELALVAFGGAGPLHAAQIADELGMRRVIAPLASGVLSALGLIVSERRRDVVESVLLAGDDLTGDAIAEAVARLGEQARDELGEPHAELRATFDLRYAGQAFELSIDGALEPDPDELREAFDRAHEERYGYSDADARARARDRAGGGRAAGRRAAAGRGRRRPSAAGRAALSSAATGWTRPCWVPAKPSSTARPSSSCPARRSWSRPAGGRAPMPTGW